MAKTCRSRWTLRGAAAVILLAVAWLTPLPAAAQQIISTAAGKPEVIAVAVNPATGATYFATDRPGAIYQATASGPVLIAGVSGGSTADGVPASQAAVFPGRNGLAIDASGTLYFSEPSLHRIRQIVTASNTVVTVAGTGLFRPGDPGQLTGNWAIFTTLAAPGALAFNPTNGDLLVADEAWDIVYRLVAASAPVQGSSAAVMAVGGDPSNTSIYVEYRFYNPFGYAGDGGPAIDAKLSHPRGLAFDAAGNLYIADTGNNVIRRVDTSNTITTFAGTSVPGNNGDNIAALSAQLFMPTGVAVDAAGDVIIANAADHSVRAILKSTGVIVTIAGDGTAGHSGDGNGSSEGQGPIDARFAFPTGVALDPAGEVVVADSQNNRVRVIGTSVKTVAQTGPDYAGDGAPAGDALNTPLFVVVDRAGNVFFSDSGNGRVRRRDAATGALTTVAGNGIPGSDGDGGAATAARLNCPAGLAFGPGGQLYVADPCAQVVRRVDAGVDGLVTGAADEIITTFAGNGIGDGYAGYDNQPAASVSLMDPYSLAADGNGTLFIGERSIGAVRTVDSTGLLGTYTLGQGARGLAVDAQGNVVVADDQEDADIECNGSAIARVHDFGSSASWSALFFDGLARLLVSDDGPNQAVFEVTAGGAPVCGGGQPTVSRIAGAGNSTVGYSGDGAIATNALLNHPAGTALDGQATTYIADSGNNVLRQLQQPVVGVVTDVAALDFGVFGLQGTSPARFVTVKSIGTAPATFSPSSIAGANPGDFTILSDACKGLTLSNGQTCQIAVALKPVDLGLRSAVLSINDNAPDTPQRVTLAGTGASVVFNPASLAFGDQTQSQPSAPQQITATNGTSQTVTITSLSFLTPADFQITADHCTGAPLVSQASCTFDVVFTPHALGTSATSLIVSSTAADSPRSIDVGGNGVPPVPLARVSPPSLSFGSITTGQQSATMQVTMSSVGTGPLLVSKVALTGNQPFDFTIGDETCTGATLLPGQNCTVKVQFTPIDVCNSTASLTFTDGAADSPQSVFLSGQGTSGSDVRFKAMLFCASHAPGIQQLAAGTDGFVWLVENGSAFSPPALGQASEATGVVHENPGAVIAGYKPFFLTFSPDGGMAYGEARGEGFQSYIDIFSPAATERLANGHIGPIGVGPDNRFWTTNQFSCGNDFPLVTVPGLTANDTLTYTPTPQWILGATNHLCVEASSLAAGPDGAMWLGTTHNTTSLLVGGTVNGFIRMTTDGKFVDFTPTDASPLATLVGADGVLYGLMGDPGNVCQLERFDANGHGTAVVMPGVLNGVLCTPGLADGADGRLWMVGEDFTGTALIPTLVAFDPLARTATEYQVPELGPSQVSIVAGPDEGIWFVGPNSTVGRFDLGGGPARAFVMPKVIALQSTASGVSSPARTIFVRSTGTAPLVVSGITLTGADASQFIVKDNCSGKSVDPGTFCTVLVASRPTRAGSHAATLLVNSNDGFSPQHVRLAEFSVPPAPTITPQSVAFSNTFVGAQGKTATLVLTNPADRGVTLQSVGVAGANSADFVITDNQCTGTLAAGTQCMVTVRFVPTAAGVRKGLLVFTDNATPATQTAQLTGTGQTPGSSGTTTGGDQCDCATGLFVNPKVVEPSVTFVSATTSTSPHGVYTLTVTPNGPNGGPSTLIVSKKGTTVMTFTSPADATWPTTAPHWGFSPDDDRFVVHYQSGHEDVIDLFDLTSTTPNVRAWSGGRLLLVSDGTGTVPSGSVGFSPHGHYLVATQIESFVGVGVAPSQTAYLSLVSASGAQAGSQISWNLLTPPTDNGKLVESAHWGFAPDDQSFVFVRDTSTGPLVSLLTLPTGVELNQITLGQNAAKYVQFGPCGEVLAVVDTATNRTNPVTITLYSTRPADPRTPIATPQTDVEAVTIVLSATATEYIASLAGFVTPLDLAPNTSAAGCAASTASGDAGGSTQDTPPQFTTDTPPNIAIQAVPYTYAFHAVGSPSPTYSLDPFAPSWLTIDSDTGVVSGTPKFTDPLGAISYTVTASNRASFDLAGPFTVTVTAPSTGGGGGGGASNGPAVGEDEAATETAAIAATDTPPPATPIATTLLLPNGRGQIALPPDVAPAITTFTYTETGFPGAGLGGLVFGGLDFTLTAVDTASGASFVAPLVDAPRAAIALRGDELFTARIRDLSRLGLYWWNGAAWVNQLPCNGCGISADGSTLTVLLSQLGEYVLAAATPPVPTFSIVSQTIHATSNQPFAGVVATFSPAIPLDVASDYAAIVDWGDGQQSVADVSAAGSGFAVSGAHTWTAPATYPIGITIIDGGASGSAQGTAIVSGVGQAPQFTAAAPPLTATDGVTYSYTFAATGTPAPAFALAPGAPGWLSIDAATGAVRGTPPTGTGSFSYSVTAANGVAPAATAGPFVVTVAPASGQAADLSVSISGPATTTHGTSTTYTLVVKNNGPSAAVNGVLLLVAGPDVAFVNAAPPPSIDGPGFWTWCFSRINAGQSMSFTVTLKPTRTGTVALVATVVADSRDPRLANNLALSATKVK